MALAWGAYRDSLMAQNREQAAAVARGVADELRPQLTELRQDDREQRKALAEATRELEKRIAAIPLRKDPDILTPRPRTPDPGERYGF